MSFPLRDFGVAERERERGRERGGKRERERRANIRKINTITSSGSNLRTHGRVFRRVSQVSSIRDVPINLRNTSISSIPVLDTPCVLYIALSRIYTLAKAEYTRPGQVGIKGSEGGPIRHDTLLNARCRERASETKLYLRHVG